MALLTPPRRADEGPLRPLLAGSPRAYGGSTQPTGLCPEIDARWASDLRRELRNVLGKSAAGIVVRLARGELRALGAVESRAELTRAAACLSRSARSVTVTHALRLAPTSAQAFKARARHWELVLSKWFDVCDLSVHVADEVVVLEGTVPRRCLRVEMERYVARTGGGSEVLNHLRVLP